VTGGYLEQLQLTKQLELQAKKAAKNREAAESKLSESEELIASAKRIEANAAKAEKMLVEASEAFSRKDYKGALSLATKSIEVAKESKTSRVEDVLLSTQELLDQMGDLTVNAGEPADAIAKARGLIEEGQLDEAYVAANDAWDLTERFINARMADEFERAQSLLLMAEGEQIDTETEREQLTQARKSLESEDYVESLDTLNSCLESVTDDLTNLFHRREQELDNGMEEVGDLDIALQRARDKLAKADAHLDSTEMEEAFSNLTIAEGEFRKSFSRTLLSAFDSIEEKCSLLATYGEDMKEAKSSIPEGRKLTRDGEQWDALEICRNLMSEMGDRELNVLLDQMYRLKPKLQISRRAGNDITEAVTLLEDSRRIMREGDFEGAVDLVHQADVMLEKELEGFREVERELGKTENLMMHAEKYGLDRDSAQESMKVARGLALKGDLAESLEQLKTAQRNLNNGIQQYLGSEIMRIELLLASAMRMGTDVSEENVMIDEVMERVRKGDYEGVDEPLEECKLKVRDFLEENAETALENARKLLHKYEGMADITSSRVILDEASSACESKDFDKTFRLAEKAVYELERQESEVLEGGLKETRRLLDINKDLGAESSTINEKVAKAESLKLDGKTKEAIEVVQDVLQLAGSPVRESIWRGLAPLSRSISSARKKGVEVVKIEKLTERVSKYLEREFIADAYDTLHRAEEELRTVVDQHREISELIEEVEGLLKEAKDNGIDASGAEQLFQQTRLLFDSGEYQRAIELARKTMEEAETQTAPVMAPRRLQELRNIIATGKRIGVDVSREEAGTEAIQRTFDSGDYAATLTATQTLRRAIRTRIVEKLEDEILAARDMIVRAREVGADVSALDSIVDRGEKLLSEGRINDALRAVDLVKKELDQGMIVERKANEGIDRAVGIISNVRKAGIEPAGALEILRQAKDQAQAGRGGIALELAKKAMDQAADTARSKLMERFKNLEMSQRAMNIEGPDLAQASRMKADFRKAMEEWKFTQAVGLLKNLEEELSRVERQKKLAARTLEETEAKVEEARKRGLMSEKVEELLKDSKDRMEEGIFSSAFSVAIRCRDELRSLGDLYDRRIKDLKKLRDRMKHVGEEGVDVAEAEGYFDKAEGYLRDLKFEEASLNLSRGDTALRRSMGRLMEARRSELRNLYRVFCDMELKNEGIGDLASSLIEKKRLRMEDFDQLGECLGQLRELLTNNLRTMAGEIEGRIQVAANSGADVSTSEHLLTQARELIAEGNISEAHMVTKESEGSIGVAMDERREYMELRMRCESLVENARRNGLVMEGVIDLFARAEGERESSYSDAIGSMKEALKRAEEEAGSYLPELDIDIDFIDAPVMNQWMRARVKITNDSRAMARDVEMELSGEIEVRGLETIKKFRGNESKEIEFEILPLRRGGIEVTFSLSCRPVLSDDTFGFESKFELDTR